MSSKRSRATFEPIPPDFDLSGLVEDTPNFQYVDRISCDMIDQQGVDQFDKLVLLHVIIGGKPLVIDGYQSRLDEWTFSSKWLQDNLGSDVENATNLTKKEPLQLTLSHYLRNLSTLTDQYFENSQNYKDKNRQRIYLKDKDCPQVWHDKLKEHLPPNLFYWNESTGDIGGPGADDELLGTAGRRKGRGIAPAGDVMSSLPLPMRAENMMCYIGHEGTYTPAHREMCASLGHNIMVETSDVLGDDGKPERPGSSIWFMTETKDRQTVSEYWLSILGHDIQVENHFAQIAAWKNAPFSVYVVEQKAGDFILIPPLAPHQVWNRGTRTMKAAWNRTTVETLDMALKEALPNARLVCRDEQYKNKAIVYYSLQKYSSLLAKARDQQRTAPSPQQQAALRQSPKVRQLQKDFKRLLHLFKDILLSEMFGPDHPQERNVQFFPYDSNITCAYCRGNIFNRFLTCSTCADLLGTEQPEPYDICMECFAMGRSCGCISKFKWAEQFKWKELVNKFETWRRQYIEIDGGAKPDSPYPLQDERDRLNKNTLAQICQTQLKRRPWVDIRKPQEEEPAESDSDEQIETNEDGTVIKRKKKKRRSETWLKHHRPCHVCCHRHEKWKMVECRCGRWWCFGTLFRGHDLMPQTVMEDPNWTCPHCKGICRAGKCRRDPRQKPYEPKGTLIGHDTKKVADARSVESLVDFSVSNLSWLNESTDTPMQNDRLRKRQGEADRAKQHDPSLDDPYASENEVQSAHRDARAGIEYEGVALDPQLQVNGQQPSAEIIDPSLPGDGSQSRQFTSINAPGGRGHSHSNGMHFSNNDSSLHDQDSEHQPSFVAPSAVMYNPTPVGEPDAEGDAVYPDIDNEYNESPVSGKRKPFDDGAIKRVPQKKQRRDNRDSLGQVKPMSSASKQFRKEQERKALEEARRSGHFIKVSAALKGKSKIVSLKAGRENLRLVNRVGNATDDGNVVLRSDIAPPQPEPTMPPPNAKGAKQKQVRIRVEKDEDFKTRRRAPRKSASGSKKYSSQDFEDVELMSGSEDEEGETAADAALATTNAGKKKRRISSWQARRHEDDEDLPEELPSDWKDGRRNRTRQSVGGRRATTKPAGKTVSQIRPVRYTSLTIEDEGDTGDESESQENQVDHIQTAAAALREANKPQAPPQEDEFDEESEDKDASVKPVASASGMVGKRSSGAESILANRGPADRMVKIVQSASRQKAAG